MKRPPGVCSHKQVRAVREWLNPLWNHKTSPALKSSQVLKRDRTRRTRPLNRISTPYLKRTCVNCRIVSKKLDGNKIHRKQNHCANTANIPCSVLIERQPLQWRFGSLVFTYDANAVTHSSGLHAAVSYLRLKRRNYQYVINSSLTWSSSRVFVPGVLKPLAGGYYRPERCRF